jgi:hypothetical protein
VDLVQDINSHTEYVMKRCSIARAEKYEVVKKEIKMLQTFKGTYIVEYLGSEIARDPNGGQEVHTANCCVKICPRVHVY